MFIVVLYSKKNCGFSAVFLNKLLKHVFNVILKLNNHPLGP